ncbi:MAG: hypothetical protein KF910_08430 [Brevundimonas sp.]|uniref:hypothetical protein n=1 Tax=Brevundimonas sp. TaxID=1871086 RepID=UPI0025BC5E4D|nr:hypothetical protein [Brevundimonas sp.]MBX3477620.1 hypothetical protein [Brevundimonas sp.]
MRIVIAALAGVSAMALAGAAAAQSTSAPHPTTLNAPNGQPAATATTTASSPVHNPTDGQVDGHAPHSAPSSASAPAEPRAIATANARVSARGPLRPTDSSMAPVGQAEGGVTESAPMPTTLNAPNGQRASGVIVVSAPPIRNPTDGRVDGPRAPK